MRTEGAGAWRFIVPNDPIRFIDRLLGPQQSLLSESMGDFVVVRANGQSSYHLAVVVDDEWDGISDVVRGDDLVSSTARQIALQQRLAYRRLRYLHIPVVKNAHGQKLSKQQGAEALRSDQALENLRAAASHLGLGELQAGSLEGFLTAATSAWAERWIGAEAPAASPEQGGHTEC
jgi:glutamyl-Q tRNA(Asp) synthetase